MEKKVSIFQEGKDLNTFSGHSSMKKDMEVMVEFDLSNFYKGNQA